MSGELCDYGDCGLAIRERCGDCGGSFCARHIEQRTFGGYVCVTCLEREPAAPPLRNADVGYGLSVLAWVALIAGIVVLVAGIATSAWLLPLGIVLVLLSVWLYFRGEWRLW